MWKKTCREQKQLEKAKSIRLTNPLSSRESARSKASHQVDFSIIESPLSLIQKKKAKEKQDATLLEYASLEAADPYSSAARESSYGRLVEHTKVAPMKTRMQRVKVRESPMYIGLIYND